MTKKISFTPSLTSLVNPVSKVVGQEAGNFVQEKIDSWKEKRKAKNIQEHIKKVSDNISDEIKEERLTIKQVELFSEWSNGAQEVEVDEGMISRLWQKLLADIATGKNIDKHLIDILKKLTSKEAELLLRLKSSSLIYQKEKNLYYLESIEKMGLAKSNNIINVILWIFTGIIIFIFLFFSFGYLSEIYSYQRKYEYLGVLLLSVFPAILVCLFLFQIYSKKILHIWKISWLGRDLTSGVSNDQDS